MNSRHIFKKSILAGSVGVFIPLLVFAQDYGLKRTADEAGLLNYGSDVPTLIGSIIGSALSLVGVVFFLLMLYGGILWMTARGDESRATKAKETITAAVIGLVIVFASYALTSFIFSALEGRSGGTSTQGGTINGGDTGGTTETVCTTASDCGGSDYECIDNLCVISTQTIQQGYCYLDFYCSDQNDCNALQPSGLTCGGPTGNRCGFWSIKDCSTASDCQAQFGGSGWVCRL